MGFGQKFMNVIKAIYNSPSAKLKINNSYLDYIYIERGIRQGCPLSPLLFAIVIETVASELKVLPYIHGVQMKGESEVMLFADDMLLFITHPISTLTHLQDIWHDFEKVLGLTINQKKFNIPAISMTKMERQEIKKRFKFQWPNQFITYLGISISSNLIEYNLIEYNHKQIILEMQKSINSWESRQLS